MPVAHPKKQIIRHSREFPLRFIEDNPSAKEIAEEIHLDVLVRLAGNVADGMCYGRLLRFE